MVTNDLGACEWFVWDLRRSGLIDRGQLDQVVSDFLKRNPRAEAPQLAEHLVAAGTLTAFQAERILGGKAAGLVLGPYILIDAIGQGSMGQVYKASSKNDSGLYAVKVLPRRSMWNVRLARRQVRTFGSFQHPAVVPFVDVGTAGGLHYLTWPLAEGSTLDNLVQQQGRLSPAQSAHIACQIAQGLSVCHQQQIFHGLLKPSNVMVGPDGQTRLLDFGIGSLLVENEGESLVDTMSTANTLTSGLDCAAPESIMDPTNRTPAGDQYSLGCVLYFCLAGQPPFPDGSAVEKMMAHQIKEPEPVRTFAQDCPEGLAGVVAKLMSKKPEDRYRGADEVAEALEPFLGEYFGAAPPPSAPAARTPPPRAATPPARPATLPNPASGAFAPQRPAAPTPPPAATPLETPFGASPARASFGAMPPRPAPAPLPGRDTFRQAAPVEEPADVPLTPASPADSGFGGGARASMSWMAAQQQHEEQKKPALGTAGIVALTATIMVAVWFVATKLMGG